VLCMCCLLWEAYGETPNEEVRAWLIRRVCVLALVFRRFSWDIRWAADVLLLRCYLANGPAG